MIGRVEEALQKEFPEILRSGQPDKAQVILKLSMLLNWGLGHEKAVWYRCYPE